MNILDIFEILWQIYARNISLKLLTANSLKSNSKRKIFERENHMQIDVTNRHLKMIN